MIDDEFKALLMHKIFFLFLCGQLWPEFDSSDKEHEYIIGVEVEPQESEGEK